MRRALLAALLLLAACHGRSPTEPVTQASLAGTWQGTLEHPNFGAVQLVINADLVSGQLNGHPVTVHTESGRYFIEYVETTGTYCVFSLIVTELRSDQLSGFTGGRCPNTILSSPFELVRAR